METKLSRRGLLSILGTVSLSGCVQQDVGTSQTAKTSTGSPTETNNHFDCGTSEDTVEEVLRQYKLHAAKLRHVTSAIGSKSEFEVDAVMGADTAFNAVNCQRPSCRTQYYTAIDRFEGARETVVDARDGFNELKQFAEGCDVTEKETVLGECENGIAKSEKFIEAIDLFIESVERHIDDEVPTFTPGSTFDDGLSVYREARYMPLMNYEDFEGKLTVYSG